MATRTLTGPFLVGLFAPMIRSVPRLVSYRPLRRESAPSHRQTSIFGPTARQSKFYSTESSGPISYSFQDIKSLSTSPDPKRILIDVREPHEFSEGAIATARNMPIKSQPEGLFLPADEFEERFGFAKPAADTEVVFYCRSGVRSRAAAQLAVQCGYRKVGDYGGSWMDWVKNGGEASK